MVAITLKAEAEVALDRVVSRIDETARDAGHRVGRWDYGEATASLRCEACGLDAAARVYPGGRVWSAGRLKTSDRCPKATS